MTGSSDVNAIVEEAFQKGLGGNQFTETQVGLMPESWELFPLGTLLRVVQYGLSVRGEGNGRYPILRMNCQESGRVVFRDLQYVDLDQPTFDAFKLQDGDLLFNRTNSFELVGRTAIFRGDRAAVFASYLIRLRVDDQRIIPDFLNYYLNLNETQTTLKTLATRGVSQSNISASKLKWLMIPVPPMEEQRAMVSVLNMLHDRVGVQNQIVATLKGVKAVTMLRLFRYGLHGETVKPTEIGEIPESWEVVALRSLLFEPLRNGHSARSVPGGDGVRTLTLTAVTQKDFSFANSKVTSADPSRVRDLWLNNGDILVERANTPEMVGLAALYRGSSDFAIFPDLLIRVRVKPERLLPAVLVEWLLLPWCRTYFQKHCRGAATSMPKIDHRTLEAVPVPIPSMQEQQKIARVIGALESRISTARQHASAVKLLFSTMLHLLLTGQVRVAIGRRVGGDGMAPQAESDRWSGDSVTLQKVERFVSELVRRFEPERVILFGSDVPGSPRADAGVGLLVVMAFEGRALGQAAPIERELNPGFPVDLVVRRPEDVDRALGMGNAFIKGIVERGRVLYARPVEATGTETRVEPGEPTRPLLPKRTLSQETLREIVRRIVAAVAPEKIILFGSAARGEMGPDSDVDLLVVKSGVDRQETARKVRRGLLGIGVAKDVIVATPDDLARCEHDRDSVISSALSGGRVVYAV